MGCLYVDREASARKRGSASGAPSADSGSTNGSAGSDSDAAGAQPRVSDAVRRRMDDVATGRLPGARPLLLFPEGTTTNGRFLLPFKTGAFLAGQPLQPVVIRYGEVGAGEAGRIWGQSCAAGLHALRQAGKQLPGWRTWRACMVVELASPRADPPASPRPRPHHAPRTACPPPGR